MAEILANYIPNVLNNQAELLKSIKETLIMVSVSGIISLVIGILIGVLLVVTKKGNILENRTINNIFDKAINIFRSILFNTKQNCYIS